jgi:3'(2'), 5'-bisphosphate nucleotidase
MARLPHEKRMPDFKDRQQLVDALVEIVKDAGREIMKIYASDFDVVAKEDASPLTQADLASHRAIRDALNRLTPDIPVLSEESDLPDFVTRKTWNRYWLVDPLDGTKEFVNRNGEFTVNIALIDGHRATLGVVGVPAQDIVYSGDVAERRAQRRDQHGVVAMHTRRMDRERELVVVASRSHGGERLEAFIDGLGERFNAVNRTPVGSSLKLCILAEGRADLYPRLGPTSEWDIAAAHAVLEAAGGAVMTFDHEPLRYNTKESLLNPEFLAVADEAFDWWSALPPIASA